MMTMTTTTTMVKGKASMGNAKDQQYGHSDAQWVHCAGKRVATIHFVCRTLMVMTHNSSIPPSQHSSILPVCVEDLIQRSKIV